MNPLPTPYDIAPIPYFPYQATSLLWIALFVVFVIAIALAFRPRKRPVVQLREDHEHPLRDAENSLERVRRSLRLDPEEVFNATRRLKRVLKDYEDLDFSSMSPAELRSSVVSDTATHSASLISCLVTLEEMKYSKELESAQLKKLCEETLKSLRDYRRAIKGAVDAESSENGDKS